VSSRAERLLSGPRGRRLCLELAMAADPAVCTFALGYDLDPGQGLSRVPLTFESDEDSSEPGDEPASTVAGLVSALGVLGATRVEPGLIQSALQRSVDFAGTGKSPARTVLPHFPKSQPPFYRSQKQSSNPRRSLGGHRRSRLISGLSSGKGPRARPSRRRRSR
jgi:hypothetical protein